MVCGNFILPEPASYVFFYAFFNLRKLLYIIGHSLESGYVERNVTGGRGKVPVVVTAAVALTEPNWKDIKTPVFPPTG